VQGDLCFPLTKPYHGCPWLASKVRGSLPYCSVRRARVARVSTRHIGPVFLPGSCCRTVPTIEKVMHNTNAAAAYRADENRLRPRANPRALLFRSSAR
jgi:hypothetical protein